MIGPPVITGNTTNKQFFETAPGIAEPWLVVSIDSVSIDMSPTCIKGHAEHLPNARITFDKFHVIVHASKALDEPRRIWQKTTSGLKGLLWKLLNDYGGRNNTGPSEGR